MKKVLIVLAILFVLFIGLIIGVVAFAVSNVDGIVKAGIERGGTWATGVTTTIDGVDVGIRAGTVDMDNLKIANPSGFSTPHFLALGDTSVQVNMETFSTDLIGVTSMQFSNIEVYLDKGGDPSNYNTILNNLKRFESGEAPAPADAKDSGTKVTIDSLVLENINVHVANMPGVGFLVGDVAVNIPRIELLNIGKDKPMNAGEVINLIVKTVLSAAIESGGGIIPNDVLGELTGGLAGLTSLSDLGIDALGDVGGLVEGINTEALENITQQGEEALEDVKEQLEETVDDAVNDVQDEIEKGIGNLFGNKKDDDG